MKIKHYFTAALIAFLLSTEVKAQTVFNEVNYTKEATTFCDWRYRMHISIEELMNRHDFTSNIIDLVCSSYR